MKQDEVETLYHLLRAVSNDKEEDTRHPLAPFNSIISGLSRHLLGGGDYLALLHYLSWYGERYLVEPITKLIKAEELEFDRVVELGAGLGWLSYGIAQSFKTKSFMVDKRPWALTSLLADLETQEGMDSLLLNLGQNDLIVMSDFLHCVDKPSFITDQLTRWPMVIVEYSPTIYFMYESYRTQVTRYGASMNVTGSYMQKLADKFSIYSTKIGYHRVSIAEPRK